MNLKAQMTRRSESSQLDLFGQVAAAYAESTAGVLDNNELYAIIAERGGLDKEDLEVRVPIGAAGAMHNPARRRVRWHQQSLKQLGLI